jgi:hypothetical protein
MKRAIFVRLITTTLPHVDSNLARYGMPTELLVDIAKL